MWTLAEPPESNLKAARIVHMPAWTAAELSVDSDGSEEKQNS